MASTVFELRLRALVFTLTIAIATFPTCADQKPCDAYKRCRPGKEELIATTTVAPSAFHESKEATYPTYKVDVRNHTPIMHLYDEMEAVTSESTSRTAACRLEETAAADLGALLDAGNGALVTLLARDTRLTAHRAVLAARSPIFAAMLCNGTQDASSGEVNITDVEGPVLRQLVAYLYTLQAPQLPGMAPQLLAAADKFGLSALKAECEVQIAAKLTVETAAATAVLAIRHSSTNLREAAIAFITAHLVEVMTTQQWANVTRYQPEDMIEVYQLLAELPFKISTPAAADSHPTTAAQRQSHSGHGQTLVAAASPAPLCPIPPPDDDAVLHLRSLSSEEKGWRLTQAAKEGRVEEVEALLAAGADLEARDGDRDRETALHWAAFKGHLEVVRRLLGCGADLEARDSVQNTPLHCAAMSGHAAVVRLLVASSADLNARDLSGWTPLHDTAYYGHAEAAAALLEAGADRGAREERGRTPLDVACQYNKQQLIQLLT